MFRLLSTVILSLFMLSANAQLTALEAGKIYRFASKTDPTWHLSAITESKVGARYVTTPTSAEMWYVSDVKTSGGTKTYRLRNYAYGRWLRGAGYNAAWSLVGSQTATYDYLYLATIGGTYNSLATSSSKTGNNKMHIQGGTDAIVTWDSSADRSMWTITEVTGISAQEIADNWKRLDELNATTGTTAQIQTYLDALFTSKGCTTLKPEFVSKTETELRADNNFTALPSALQEMVIKTWKTANGTDINTAWAEKNYDSNKPDWDGAYAKRYRIQKYEPYTDRSTVNLGFKTNVHSNFNNPTGIFARAQQPLYVMVEGTIKPGATLYISSSGGHAMDGEATDGIKLTEGLNIIPYYADLQWSQIYYNVKTLKTWDGTTNKTGYKLSDFPDLVIHIEGGCVNGYYNAVGDDLYAHGRTGENVYPQGDDENDWDYLAARNNLEDLTILGKYVTFQFYFGNTNGSNTTDYYFTKQADGTRRVRIPNTIEIWDRIALSERLMMGVTSESELNEANKKFPTLDDKSRGVFAWTGRDNALDADYTDYYRQHYLAWGMTSGYMSGGWVASNYNVNTFESILKEILNADGTMWGPGHEIGHQNQGPINMNGLTEVTNNLFANVALWYGGKCTSRINGAPLESLLKATYKPNYDFFHNDIWTQTHMYYKLWLYYHLSGRNNKFYPRLFEYLRRNPMQIKYDQQDSSGAVSGLTPLLHFYRAACIAAGEDLTEFFEAYGFFTPMSKRLVDDYSSSEYTQTAQQIAAVKAEVAAMKLPKNETILFINDATSTTTYGHDGVTPRQLFEGVQADMGGYREAFIGSTKPSGNYTLSISGENVTISGGSGAVGIKLYSTDGKLLAFSNRYTFPISQEILSGLCNGSVKVLLYASDGTSVALSYDKNEAARSRLSNLIADTRKMIQMVDNGGSTGLIYTWVGYFKAPALTDVTKALATASQIIANSNADLYNEAYEILSNAKSALLANKDAKVSYIPGSKVALFNFAYPARYMSEDTANSIVQTSVLSNGDITSILNTGKWTLEPITGSSNVYIRNAETGKYIGSLTQGNTNTPTTDATGKKEFTISDASTGFYLFACEGDAGRMLHASASFSYKVVGWYDGDATRWGMRMVDLSENDIVSENLRTLVANVQTTLQKISAAGNRYNEALTAHNINLNDISQMVTNANNLLASSSATASEKLALFNQLSASYKDLLAALESVDNADLVAARTQLTAAINDMDALLASMGTEKESEYPLQSINADMEGYLWCNAPYTAAQNGDYSVAGTDGYHLLDGDKNTFLHTAYAGTAPNEDHYLRVYAGPKGIGRFSFSYINRNGGSGHITAMTVEGSNKADGQYTVIKELNSGHPATRGAEYISEMMGDRDTKYQYIRFRVTANAINGKYQGHTWFHLAEFRMNGTSLILNPDFAEIISAQDWNKCQTLNNQAALKLAFSNSATELTEMAAALRAKINEIQSRIEPATDRSQLKEMIDEMQTLLGSDYSSALNPLSSEAISEASEALLAARTTYAIESLTKANYNKAVAAMQSALNTFKGEVAYALLPFKLTEPTAEPEAYAIVNNDATKANLEYSAAYDHRLRFATGNANNDTSYWYFVRSNTAPAVKIINTAATDRIASVNTESSILMLPNNDNSITASGWIIESDATSGLYRIKMQGPTGMWLTANTTDNFATLTNAVANATTVRFVAKKDNTSTVPTVTYEPSETAPIYTLQGIRVDNPRTGLYIINGRKVLLIVR